MAAEDFINPNHRGCSIKIKMILRINEQRARAVKQEGTLVKIPLELAGSRTAVSLDKYSELTFTEGNFRNDYND